MENGSIYLTFTNMLKLLRDANVIDGKSATQRRLSMIISKECGNNYKNINFNNFLNFVFAFSQERFPELFAIDRQASFNALLVHCFLPLLETIEEHKAGVSLRSLQ